MKIKTVKVERAHKAAKAFIKEKGATRHIGSGCYGSVYGGTGLNVVYKVGDVDINAGYLSFIRQVIKQDSHNPFTPKVFSVTIFDDCEERYFVVEMEKLKSMKRSQYPAARKIADMMYNHSDLKVDRGLAALGIKIHIPEEIRELTKMLKRAYKNANRNIEWCDAIDWDMHMGNFMQRDGQIVVTDPLA